jgi:thiamine biosynthesis protein ThiI
MVRFSGEMTTKSRRTRSRFQRALAENLRAAARRDGVDLDLQEEWSRFYLRSPDRGVVDLPARTFGVSTYSEIEGMCEPDLEAIVECGHRLWADRVKGRTFAVRARRSGEHDFDSYDVQRDLGAALNPGAEVDLDDPEVTVRVEVRPETVYLFGERRPGPGGFPPGTQARAVALVSGGFDSAVAAWLALRRGIELDYVFCNLGGDAYRRMVLEVTAELAGRWSGATTPRFHAVDFGPALEELREEVRSSYWQVVLKRLMYRAGAAVAREIGADALITGESVGQVSSQTLANLRAIDVATDYPVLRPLAGFDKEEIIERSRRIGVHDLCERVREYCAIVPDRPVTASTPERVDREMEGLDAAVVDRAVEDREVLSLMDLSPSEIASSGLFIDRVPEGARVLDVRPAEEYRAWHWPGAEHLDPVELSRGYGEPHREETYPPFCRQGQLTVHIACPSYTSPTAPH